MNCASNRLTHIIFLKRWRSCAVICSPRSSCQASRFQDVISNTIVIMEQINGVDNIYSDKKFKLYYKKDQSFDNYTYYNCFVKKCPGRVKFMHLTNVRVAMCEHKEHHSFEQVTNEVDLLRLRKKCIDAAVSQDHSDKPAAQIYQLVLNEFPEIQLPKGHKATMKRSIENARYRHLHPKSKCNPLNISF